MTRCSLELPRLNSLKKLTGSWLENRAVMWPRCRICLNTQCSTRGLMIRALCHTRALICLRTYRIKSFMNSSTRASRPIIPMLSTKFRKDAVARSLFSQIMSRAHLKKLSIWQSGTKNTLARFKSWGIKMLNCANFKMSGLKMHRVLLINSLNCWPNTTWIAALACSQTMIAIARKFKKASLQKKVRNLMDHPKKLENNPLKWWKNRVLENQNGQGPKTEGAAPSRTAKRAKCCEWGRRVQIRLSIEANMPTDYSEFEIMNVYKALTLYKSQP